jgi:hypothetical protein
MMEGKPLGYRAFQPPAVHVAPSSLPSGSLVEPIHRNSVTPKHIAVYVRFGSKADIRRARPQYDDDTGRSKVIIKKKEDSGNY